MQIVIDVNGPEPLFAQLIRQIKLAVDNARLRPGDPLPSIRQLANDLNLNNKTVAKAYRLLERDAIVETRGYRGTFVHADAKANSHVDLSQSITQKLASTVAELRDAGATDSEIRIAFGNVMNNHA